MEKLEMRSLFPLKYSIIYKANVIYKGPCSCKEFYIGETKRDSEIQTFSLENL